MRSRRWAVVALAGALASAQAARAEIDVDVDEDVRALPPPRLPSAHWLTLETPHFELHFYPEERAFAERSARVAERAYRLVTRYLNWRAERDASACSSSITPTPRTVARARYPTTSSKRSARRPTGWTSSPTSTTSSSC